MRLARRLLVIALIVGLLFVGANVVVARIAEKRIASEAQKSFGTKSPPTVKLDAFPIILQIMKGRLSHAELDGRDLVLQDLKIAHVRVVLDGIHAKFSDLTSGGPVTVDKGVATAEVTSAAVNDYVQSRGYNITVEVRQSSIVARGRVRFGTRTVSGSAQGTPTITGRLLHFTPSRVSVDGKPLSGAQLAEAKRQLSFQVDLPELPGGIRIGVIEYRPGIASMIARIANARLDLGKRPSARGLALSRRAVLVDSPRSARSINQKRG